MKKLAALLSLFISCFTASANDGAFFASGNQLIPIMETDISVKKEILMVKKVDNKFIEVTVYYEFFNPKEAKDILVGFEAGSPLGDVNPEPKNGRHPYMHDFTVDLNGKILKYDIAYVKNEDSSYYSNGKVQSQGLEKIKAEINDDFMADFYYVYHFKAHFNKGTNIVKHTYRYDVSFSVSSDYDFSYILTAAKRWANKQIDDFTLIVDMGSFATFNMHKTFFKSKNEWLINGIGKATEIVTGEGDKCVEFVVQTGNLIFQQKNFKPAGELSISAPSQYGMMEAYLDVSEDYETRTFNYRKHKLPYAILENDEITPADEISRKILKNLPFALRGYVFSTPELQQFYEKQHWYIPNPNYTAELQQLTEEERKWVEKWK